MRNITTFIIIALFLASCEKEIFIDLNSANPLIVIEGNISDHLGPYFVKISKTVNISDENNYPPVTGSLVIISDDRGIADTLVETRPGVYQTSAIIGQQGRTYKLSVHSEGKSYYATSQMPMKVNLDTLVFNQFTAQGDQSFYTVEAVFAAPAQTVNNYRFILKVNDKEDGAFNLLSDKPFNGSINQHVIFSRGAQINPGDNVEVEMRCIDESTYNYFYSLARISGMGAMGGTTPSNPPNNIEGDKALGYFSAHTSQTRSQIVKTKIE